MTIRPHRPFPGRTAGVLAAGIGLAACSRAERVAPVPTPTPARPPAVTLWTPWETPTLAAGYRGARALVSLDEPGYAAAFAIGLDGTVRVLHPASPADAARRLSAGDTVAVSTVEAQRTLFVRAGATPDRVPMVVTIASASPLDLRSFADGDGWGEPARLADDLEMPEAVVDALASRLGAGAGAVSADYAFMGPEALGLAFMECLRPPPAGARDEDYFRDLWAVINPFDWTFGAPPIETWASLRAPTGLTMVGVAGPVPGATGLPARGPHPALWQFRARRAPHLFLADARCQPTDDVRWLARTALAPSGDDPLGLRVVRAPQRLGGQVGGGQPTTAAGAIAPAADGLALESVRLLRPTGGLAGRTAEEWRADERRVARDRREALGGGDPTGPRSRRGRPDGDAGPTTPAGREPWAGPDARAGWRTGRPTADEPGSGIGERRGPRSGTIGVEGRGTPSGGAAPERPAAPPDGPGRGARPEPMGTPERPMGGQRVRPAPVEGVKPDQ